MKPSLIVGLGLFLVGCTSTQPGASLTADQAKTLAMRLANDKASAIYHRQPFHDGQPATFASGHWVWTARGSGDVEAKVELAADGSTNSVALYLLILTLY